MAVPPSPWPWSAGSCPVSPTPSSYVAQAQTSSWLKVPTMAALMTRSATQTPSRWKTHGATCLTPTRSCHSGQFVCMCSSERVMWKEVKCVRCVWAEHFLWAVKAKLTTTVNIINSPCCFVNCVRLTVSFGAMFKADLWHESRAKAGSNCFTSPGPRDPIFRRRIDPHQEYIKFWIKYALTRFQNV